jgi:hypothetical protein
MNTPQITNLCIGADEREVNEEAGEEAARQRVKVGV